MVTIAILYLHNYHGNWASPRHSNSESHQISWQFSFHLNCLAAYAQLTIETFDSLVFISTTHNDKIILLYRDQALISGGPKALQPKHLIVSFCKITVYCQMSRKQWMWCSNIKGTILVDRVKKKIINILLNHMKIGKDWAPSF